MIYAIGDIHGYADQLDRALARIAQDGGEDAPVIFLGDYVDRGPDSAGVIERLTKGQAEGRNWRFLMGNHDWMFLNFLRHGEVLDDQIKSGKGWLHPALGGPKTLGSYMDLTGFDHPAGGGFDRLVSDGLDPTPAEQAHILQKAARDAVPEAHLTFLENLPRLIETDDHIFVHAGIRPDVALADQDPVDLVWIREPFLSHTAPFPKQVVHGHTALDRPAHEGNRINLDGGAGYGRDLLPAVFDGTNWHLLTDQGRETLRPAA